MDKIGRIAQLRRRLIILASLIMYISIGLITTDAFADPCNQKPDGTTCDDHDACTVNDSCSGGVCVPGSPLNCDDGSLCTVDSCNTATGCVFTAKNCDDSNACTADSCDPTTGACVNTAITCDDNNACTTDSCNSATGCVNTAITCPVGEFCDTATGACVICTSNAHCNDNNNCTADTCVAAVCQHSADTNTCPVTAGNNFSMIDPSNILVDGTNDVFFAWDGTLKTSVAVSGQISNATIFSSCTSASGFIPLAAHDVTVYGPGSYIVYSGCSAGSPGCGAGAPINFTVGTGEIGVHVLLDWNGSTSIDVVDVMKPNAVSSNVWTGGCGSNSACTVWQWMSYDFDGDGVNGTSMLDGPLPGMNANFNLGAGTIDLCCDAVTRCNDGNACTIDTCTAATGACINTPVVIDDNDDCTNDACDLATGIISHTAISCNDGNACTGDSCNPATGCVHTVISSDDGNACTDDSCDPATGAVHTAIICDDSNACTVDTCDPATGCVHAAIICNDNEVCTTDTCVPATGCVYTPNTGPCDDNNACTTGDTCSGGVCQPGTPVVCATGPACDPVTGCNLCGDAATRCNDNNPCTTDTCVAATGNCVNTINTIACDDGNACTTGDICSNGACQPGSPLNCDDGNVCTTDSCTGGVCGHAAIPGCDQQCSGKLDGTTCDDGNACTGNDACSSGVCAGTAMNCDDGNACTDDSCSAGACIHNNNTAVCDDGNACTGNDACSSGVCAGAAMNCDDGNGCTIDSCTAGVCGHATIPGCDEQCSGKSDGTACDDGNACTGNETCSNGICAGSAKNCDDGKVCTSDSCDATTGNCVHTNNTSSCDDNNACTSGDVCVAGTCIGTAVVCNDNNACTTDLCYMETGCVYVPNGCQNGDLDGVDGVTVTDALNVLRISAGIASPTASDMLHGDVAPLVNGQPDPDGTIDIGDAVVILRKAIGLLTW